MDPMSISHTDDRCYVSSWRLTEFSFINSKSSKLSLQDDTTMMMLCVVLETLELETLCVVLATMCLQDDTSMCLHHMETHRCVVLETHRFHIDIAH